MGRHQSLRTRLAFDTDGHVRQVVAERGEVPLEIIDADDADDPAEVAAALRTRYHDTEFDYVNLDPATGRATAPVTATQPLELAAWQQGPDGRRQNERTLRTWERMLHTIPARRFAESADKREPRFWV
jgi:hypothetical protein